MRWIALILAFSALYVGHYDEDLDWNDIAKGWQW